MNVCVSHQIFSKNKEKKRLTYRITILTSTLKGEHKPWMMGSCSFLPSLFSF
ncbi:hypothetical protein Hanom_Chr12g01179961 [Helianthus anomalus]